MAVAAPAQSCDQNSGAEQSTCSYDDTGILTLPTPYLYISALLTALQVDFLAVIVALGLT